ncbi:MAG TPA: M20/M25/M40 family metallo-hydrolase [Acidimicrobiales bacterium]|nr:M20/M25/M40 family metallo-hydrolase [Acidimicrobiales bacterium]
MPPTATGEVTELLQQLIRNGCVNDGTIESGHESRSAALIEGYLEGPGLDIETYEPQPGRTSLVARVEGTDPDAPALLLMGHTDVVPANPDGWSRDPFGGELHDGFVWGRGAIDMLNLTASMAVATKALARGGFRPRGDLIYLAVADEEALGEHGAKHLVDHERDAVRADFVLRETGGIPIPTDAGPRLPVIVGEKGSCWCTLRITGTPGHASAPLRTDNALVKAAEVVRRIAEFRPQTQIHDVWRRFVEGMGWPPELTEPLLDPDKLFALVQDLPLGLARQAHACTHTTFSPTVMHAGSKTNVIPDQVDLQIDIRTLPGQTGADVEAMLAEIIGPDLRDCVSIIGWNDDPSTASATDGPLWDAIGKSITELAPTATPVPFLTVGATDARFFRRVGATAYGFGLFSSKLSFEDYATMFHGDDERVDVESLRLSTEVWQSIARHLLAP